MGKNEEQNLRQQRSHEVDESGGSSGFLCEGCSMALGKVAKEFNFKCFLFLILGFMVFLSGLFWVLPLHTINYGFEAKDVIKLSATVQAYFRLEKPVKELLPHIARLEYDITGEIGVPDVKVAVLSMHDVSNWTNVVFGFLSDPITIPINPVSLSVLRSSLVELFLRESNLTLTTSIFGRPFAFETLKFQGGITVIPPQSASIWQIPQILFNFTLNNSTSEILENFVEFRDQLRFGLHLRPSENIFVQITNADGSTIFPPVVVQASVLSDFGSLMPQRLKQLAEIITGSPARNLGLNNTVFGNVKSISLSSYLKGRLHSTSPTPSPAPAPAPELSDNGEPSSSPHPSRSLSNNPVASPDISHLPPRSNCEASSPIPSAVIVNSRPCRKHGHMVPPILSPLYTNPSIPPVNKPCAPAPHASDVGPTSQLPPHNSPRAVKDKGSEKDFVSQLLASSVHL